MSIIPVATHWTQQPYNWLGAPAMASALFDATGEKVAMLGTVWNKARATKNISKVGFRFGGVTKAGGSVIRVSLQDVIQTAGAPYQPDEVQDQFIDIANADAGFTTSAYYHTGALSGTRTVLFGEYLAVVWEFDAGGRLGADAINIQGASVATASKFFNGGCVAKSGSWTSQNVACNVVLEYDDGTFGTLKPGFPAAAISSTAFNSGSGADELAMAFKVDVPCWIDGAAIILSAASAAANFDVVLYAGTTVIDTAPMDANAQDNATSVRLWEGTFATNPALTPGVQYYLALKPTTANNVTLYHFDMNAAAHFQAHEGGLDFNFSSRVDGGSWAALTTTRRPFAALRISGLENGAGGAGGGALIMGGTVVR